MAPFVLAALIFAAFPAHGAVVTAEPPDRVRPPVTVENDDNGPDTKELIVIQMKADVHWARFSFYGEPNWFEFRVDEHGIVRAKLIEPSGEFIRGYLSRSRTPFNAQRFAPLDPGFAETLRRALAPLLDGEGAPPLPEGWDPYTWIFLDFGKPFVAWGTLDGLEIDPEAHAVEGFVKETRSRTSDFVDNLIVIGMTAGIGALEYWKYGLADPATATACVVTAAAAFVSSAACKPYFYHRPLLVRYAAKHPEWQWLRTRPHLNTVVFGVAVGAVVEGVRTCVRLLTGI